MKPYKGQIMNIRCGISLHNHLVIMGQSVGHPVYDGGSMHTSGIERIEFYMDDMHAEIETHNSRYCVSNDDFVKLLSLDKSMFEDLEIVVK